MTTAYGANGQRPPGTATRVPGDSVGKGGGSRPWPMRLRLEHLPGAPVVAADLRAAGPEPVLFLHGLACGKQSFTSAFAAAALRPFSLCAIDLPGHGDTAPAAPGGDQLEAYAAHTAVVVDLLAAERVHIVGHSMGTAVGLLAADHLGSRLGAFVSIEGNLVGDDCSLVSRAIATESLDRFRASGFGDFLTELDSDSDVDVQTWGGWARRCDAGAVHAAARSLVAWSDSGALAERYRRLRSRTYLHGARGGRPDHLNGLVNEQEAHCIAESGHFPMIDNPRELWPTVAAAIGQVCGGSDNSTGPVADLMQAN